MIGTMELFRYEHKFTPEEKRDAKSLCFVGKAGPEKARVIDAFVNTHLEVDVHDKVRYTLFRKD